MTIDMKYAKLLEPSLRNMFMDTYKKLPVMKGLAQIYATNGQMAAYKAWDTRKANKQDHSKLDLELTEMERAIKEAVAMVKNA
ncbi:hypothetical protein LCGC14_1807530 [marine sediment metagenome]|uniref:Uncharacterized protein n=1 Tax=marine sediment metagenome TaxID=412755 RepID=A0A0F9HAR7_9ZZZZ